MQVESIEIHTGRVDFDYTPVRELEAKCEATTAFSRTPSMDDVNSKLRQMAASVGANAVINVEYKNGVSMTSWKSMKATGLAVRRETDDMPCPICAETIKRAAKRCRFCGADLGTPAASSADVPARQPVASRQPWAQSEPAPKRAPNKYQLTPAEPLRSTDNPRWLIPVILLAVFLLSWLASSF